MEKLKKLAGQGIRFAWSAVYNTLVDMGVYALLTLTPFLRRTIWRRRRFPIPGRRAQQPVDEQKLYFPRKKKPWAPNASRCFLR
jgi:hypothetical protein